MSCGSYVVKMEEKKRRWPLAIAPLVVVLATVFLVIWFNKRAEDVAAEAHAKLSAPRAVDPAMLKQLEQEEREQIRAEERQKSIQQARQKRAEQVKADEKWHATPVEEKSKYLKDLLEKSQKRIASLQKNAEGLSTQDLVTWLANLESKVTAAVTFLDAGQHDQARGLLEGVKKELDELAPEQAAP